MNTFGRHLLVEYYDCDKEILNNLVDLLGVAISVEDISSISGITEPRNIHGCTRVQILMELSDLPVERDSGPAESTLQHELAPPGVKHHRVVYLHLLISGEFRHIRVHVFTVSNPNETRIHLVARIYGLEVSVIIL